MIPPSHLDAVRRELPRSRVELLPRSGHFPHLDEPERFTAAVLAFLGDEVTASHPETGVRQPPAS